MENPNMDKERTASTNEKEKNTKENLHVDEERRESSNEKQYAQWKMNTLSAQVKLAKQIDKQITGKKYS